MYSEREERPAQEQQEERRLCNGCGEELYTDCVGMDRCEYCGPPCPCCSDQ